MRKLTHLINNPEDTLPECTLEALEMEFMNDLVAEQSKAQTTFVRMPSDRSVSTDICPADSLFVASRDKLD